jgi:hypothetical protein
MVSDIWEDALETGSADTSDQMDTIDVEDAVNELNKLVTTAVNFIESQFMPEWESAQKYYDGLTDLPTIDGRSKVVSTQVRDAIRNARPSLLRVFLQANTVVEYIPNGATSAPLARQQSKFVNSLFFRSNGYRALYDAMQNAMLKKIGVMKFWWDDATVAKYFDFTAVPAQELERIMAQQDMQIIDVTESKSQPLIISPDGSEIQLFDCCVAMFDKKGEIRVESIPLEEFFIDENANSVADARVIGHRRQMRVGDGVAMGFDFRSFWTN